MLRPHQINLHGPPPMSVFHDSIYENCAVICVNFHGGSYYWVLKRGTVFYAFTKFTDTLHNYYHTVIEQQVNFLIHYESVATKSIVHILHMQPQSLDFLLFYCASLASSLLLLNPDLPICFTATFFLLWIHTICTVPWWAKYFYTYNNCTIRAFCTHWNPKNCVPYCTAYWAWL